MAKPPKVEQWVHEGHTYTVGDEVLLDVTWKGGRVTRGMRGTLISIAGDEAFMESSFGAVAGPLASLEPA